MSDLNELVAVVVITVSSDGCERLQGTIASIWAKSNGPNPTPRMAQFLKNLAMRSANAAIQKEQQPWLVWLLETYYQTLPCLLWSEYLIVWPQKKLEEVV